MAKVLSKNKQKQLLNEKPIKENLTKEGKNKTSLDSFSSILNEALEKSLSSDIEKEDEVVTVSRKDATEPDDSEGGSTVVQVPTNSEKHEDKSKVENANPKNSTELASEIQKIIDYYNSKTDMELVPEEYRPKVPENLGLQKIDVPVLDKDALKSEVEKQETDKINKEKAERESASNKKIENILAEIESKKETTSETSSEINEIYDEYKISAENEAVKRGLARSSFVLLNLNGIEKSRAEALSQTATNLEKEIGKLENEITTLKNELVEALNNLDLELGENINTELKNRISEIEEKQKEAIEFNNNVSRLEAEYAAKKNSYVQDSIELENYLKEEYQGAAKRMKHEDVLNLATKYFSTKDKKSALKELVSSPQLAAVLGDMYYDIYYIIMRREY